MPRPNTKPDLVSATSPEPTAVPSVAHGWGTLWRSGVRAGSVRQPPARQTRNSAAWVHLNLLSGTPVHAARRSAAQLHIRNQDPPHHSYSSTTLLVESTPLPRYSLPATASLDRVRHRLFLRAGTEEADAIILSS